MQFDDPAWAASRPGFPGVVVGSVPSTDDPRATINVWLIVTRIWLLVFVCQLAKNAGVLKKPTRGVTRTISLVVRSAGRSKKRVGAAVDLRAIDRRGHVGIEPVHVARAHRIDRLRDRDLPCGGDRELEARV